MSAKAYLYGRKRRPSMERDRPRTALYLRVSTPDQKPDLQYDGLRAYAVRAGLEVVQDYCDVGVSGRREGRPLLNALMSAARNREIDCVLVWKFDRFARSTRHLLAALEEFNHLGVRFISVQDQVDTDSPMGRAMFTIIGAMAELESSLISERVTAGMRAAETRGKHLGRPATHYASSTRSRLSPRPLTSAFAKFRARLLAKRAGGSSEKSPNAPAPPSRRPCDHFLHVHAAIRVMPSAPDHCGSRARRSGASRVAASA